MVVAAVVAGVDGADDAPADLAQLPGLGLGQRVEDQAADLLDVAGRGPGHLRPALAGQDRLARVYRPSAGSRVRRTAHTRVRGQLQAQRYYTRVLGHLPYGPGAALVHAEGSPRAVAGSGRPPPVPPRCAAATPASSSTKPARSAA